MKSLKLILISALLSLALVGCGKKEEAAPAAAPVTATSTEAAPVTDPTTAAPVAEAPVTDATKTGVQDVRPDAAGQR